MSIKSNSLKLLNKILKFTRFGRKKLIKKVIPKPRFKSINNKILDERTVGKIFDQILASEANYLKWEEVLPFFTRGGAP